MGWEAGYGAGSGSGLNESGIRICNSFVIQEMKHQTDLFCGSERELKYFEFQSII